IAAQPVRQHASRSRLRPGLDQELRQGPRVQYRDGPHADAVRDAGAGRDDAGRNPVRARRPRRGHHAQREAHQEIRSEITMQVTRRNVTKAMLGAGAVPALWSAAPKRIQIGYTALTWNAGPRTPENLEPALKDMSELGFYCFETFAEALETLDTQG